MGTPLAPSPTLRYPTRAGNTGTVSLWFPHLVGNRAKGREDQTHILWVSQDPTPF